MQKKSTKDKNNIMKSYVDSTTSRITTFMKDIGTGNMAKIEDKTLKFDSIFPKDRYKVVLTGKR
jgi:hypothetical protein